MFSDCHRDISALWIPDSNSIYSKRLDGVEQKTTTMGARDNISQRSTLRNPLMNNIKWYMERQKLATLANELFSIHYLSLYPSARQFGLHSGGIKFVIPKLRVGIRRKSRKTP